VTRSFSYRKASVLLAVSAAACQPVVSGAAYPLYPKIDAGPGPGKVALLRGPVEIVDGVGVSGKGPSFELLPGCHLVAVDAGVGEGGNDAGNGPQAIFAFEMRPGYVYTVTTGDEAPAGHSGRPQVIAQERAPDGSVVRVPRARAADVKDCRGWAKSHRY